MDNKNENTISIDNENNKRVDAGLPRQDIANRMAKQQEIVPPNFAGAGRLAGTKGHSFRKSIVYMTLFGIMFSVLGWGLGEIPQQEKNRKIQETFESVYVNPEASGRPQRRPEVSEKEEDKQFESLGKITVRLELVWWIIAGVCLSFGLSIAEGVVSRNFYLVLINGVIGAALGGIGFFIIFKFYIAIRDYFLLSGEYLSMLYILEYVQYCISGLFLAITPGIVMRSRKRIMLGLLGGLLGGLFCALLSFLAGRFSLFLLLSFWTGDPSYLAVLIHPSLILVRFATVFGLGIGTAVATVILENITKRGWLTVATGSIAGKQFILYWSPTVIGSSPRNSICLCQDQSVAPEHAAINKQNGAFILTSTAPVLVNNNVLERQQELKSGDQIQIGQTIFIFEEKAKKGR